MDPFVCLFSYFHKDTLDVSLRVKIKDIRPEQNKSTISIPKRGIMHPRHFKTGAFSFSFPKLTIKV